MKSLKFLWIRIEIVGLTIQIRILFLNWIVNENPRPKWIYPDLGFSGLTNQAIQAISINKIECSKNICNVI